MLATAALAFSAAASAGDSALVVQDDAATCSKRTGAPAQVVLSSESVLAGLQRSLTIRGYGLPGYLSNGRITFCTPKEQAAVEKGLIDLGARPQLVEERWWRDLVLRLGTASLLRELDLGLARPGLPPPAKRRLAAARARLSKRLKARPRPKVL